MVSRGCPPRDAGGWVGGAPLGTFRQIWVENGAFIERNAGEGGDFSTVNLRVMRTFRLRGRAQLDGLVEAFNLFDRRNDLARVTVFGTGAYPTNPAVNYGQVTVVGDPRSIQFGLRFRY